MLAVQLILLACLLLIFFAPQYLKFLVPIALLKLVLEFIKIGDYSFVTILVTSAFLYFLISFDVKRLFIWASVLIALSILSYVLNFQVLITYFSGLGGLVLILGILKKAFYEKDYISS